MIPVVHAFCVAVAIAGTLAAQGGDPPATLGSSASLAGLARRGEEWLREREAMRACLLESSLAARDAQRELTDLLTEPPAADDRPSDPRLERAVQLSDTVVAALDAVLAGERRYRQATLAWLRTLRAPSLQLMADDPGPGAASSLCVAPLAVLALAPELPDGWLHVVARAFGRIDGGDELARLQRERWFESIARLARLWRQTCVRLAADQEVFGALRRIRDAQISLRDQLECVRQLEVLRRINRQIREACEVLPVPDGGRNVDEVLRELLERARTRYPSSTSAERLREWSSRLAR
ncbi:MAG: hypothetical protein IPM29_04470 [Planctomycetes bacterium]|nr:hypothetical protein [Planctomycetota bacterium]